MASSRASGLSQTMKLPEAFASSVSRLANTQASAMGNVEAGYAGNMAGFGNNMASSKGQEYMDYGTIFSNSMDNLAKMYREQYSENRLEPFRNALLKSMQTGNKVNAGIY